MARARLNPIIRDLRGSIGNVTFRRGPAGLQIVSRITHTTHTADSQRGYRDGMTVLARAFASLPPWAKARWKKYGYPRAATPFNRFVRRSLQKQRKDLPWGPLPPGTILPPLRNVKGFGSIRPNRINFYWNWTPAYSDYRITIAYRPWGMPYWTFATHDTVAAARGFFAMLGLPDHRTFICALAVHELHADEWSDPSALHVHLFET